MGDDRVVPALGVASALGAKRYVFNDALTRQLAAFHEAGHAVVSVATRHPLHATEIASDGSGWTPNRPGDSKVLLDFKKPEDRSYARRIALICLAGESAEGSALASLLGQLALPPGNAPEVLAEAAEADRAQAVHLVADLQWEELHGAEARTSAEGALQIFVRPPPRSSSRCYKPFNTRSMRS